MHRLLGALDIPEGGTVSVSIMTLPSYAALFERVTLAGGTVSVVVFALACLTVTIVPSPVQSLSYVVLKTISLA
jgi:hypothetical protein